MAVAAEDEHDGRGVGEEGNGSGHHVVTLGAGVGVAGVADGDAEGGEGNGGSGTEESGKAFGADDAADEREKDDGGASYEEAQDDLGWRHRGATC